ncbi:hypothetical protein M441DRAFT_394360 [Trichoderma asperellum CBS 433.97]|uniref:Uncharacterized protein n=1 Tax=Trichoderma asperellum (strain ATCC 204424 / CBS 433.97 / NBRC 101777) TaxID=1042311 RepID=A0A2T3YQE7_TRIA4|nr:hypothetical protein M441DRAFT_394360 [Trichoderma asperellum CBS 433.97]PTB34754.1 hypothetical protein M441DRAFT_394360 [Trichoderma asperellum CBS 433.97]
MRISGGARLHLSSPEEERMCTYVQCTAQVQTECGVLQSPRPRPMYVASIVCCIVWARL